MDKSVKLLSKVKAEMVILRETIAHDSDPVMIEVAKNLLAKRGKKPRTRVLFYILSSYPK